jgi:hypothetical protein
MNPPLACRHRLAWLCVGCSSYRRLGGQEPRFRNCFGYRGKLFGEALSALGLGGPDLAGMLQDVTNRLVVIDRTMNEIKQGVQQILQQLESLRIHLDQSLLEVNVLAAFAKIDTAYGTADSPLRGSVEAEKEEPAPSLMELLTSLPRAGLTPVELKRYADAFILAEGKQWDNRHRPEFPAD